MIPEKSDYLKAEIIELNKIWPDNKTMNIVCHGHSLPCGYTANHVVRMRDAYPRLLQDMLCSRFPMAVLNMIITAVGGEGAINGVQRFEKEVLCHNPRILTIDYGRNDMFYPVKEVEKAWGSMIEKALKKNIKVLLITPAPDSGQIYYDRDKRLNTEEDIINMVVKLASEYGTGLADAAGAFRKKFAAGESVSDYMISVNHLNRDGNRLIAGEILKWFPYPDPL